MALAVVVIAEILLRLPGAASLVGEPDLYYSGDVQVRLDALEAVRAKNERIDVLFVGSSVVRANISPLEFDRVLGESDSEVVSFNGGLSTLWPDMVRLYLDRLWLDAVRPRVVLQAIRYEEVVNYEFSTEAGGGVEGRYETVWQGDSAGASIREFVLGSSRLAQYSGWLTNLLADANATLGGTARFTIDQRGYAATRVSLTEWLARTDVKDIPGGGVATTGFNEAIELATFAAGLEILAETIRLVRGRGVEYVLFNMPEHGGKFLSRPDGAARYRFYVDTLRAFARDQGVAFIDFTDGDASVYATEEPFADFHHMTPEGSRELTRRLAEAFLTDPLRPLLESGGAATPGTGG